MSGNGGAGNTENPVFKALFPKEYANYKDHNSIKSNAELKVEALLEKYPQLKDMNLDFSEIIKLIELIEKNPDLEVEIDLKNLGWDEFNYRESSGGRYFKGKANQFSLELKIHNKKTNQYLKTIKI